MANYATLIAAIQSVITQNGNNEITGPILQQTLISVVNSLGSGYQFIGIATPETTPGTPDQKVFYIGSAGTYPNFGPATIPSGSLGVFYYDSSWHYGSVAFPLGDGAVSTSKIQDGAVTELKLATSLIQKLLNDGFVYAGIATTNTNPGTPTKDCFYFAQQVGTYSNFGLSVSNGQLAIFKYSNSTWTKDVINIPISVLNGNQPTPMELVVDNGSVMLRILGGNLTLDSVAYGGLTYRQIFETNNWLGINPGFENGSYSPLTVSAGSPTIQSAEKDSGTYALKATGTTSQQVRTSGNSTAKGFIASRVKITSYTSGYCGIQFGAGNVGGASGITDWVTVVGRKDATTQNAAYVGSFNSANLTGYVDTPVVVLDSVFSTVPTTDQFEQLYNIYVRLKKGEAIPQTSQTIYLLTSDGAGARFVNNGSSGDMTLAVTGDDVELTVDDSTATLDSIAYGGLTYRQIFETNNMLGISPGFESGNYSPLVVGAGSPSVQSSVKDSGTYALMASGTSSQQVKTSSTNITAPAFIACRVKVTSYTAGYCGIQYSSAGSVGAQAVTDWNTFVGRKTGTSGYGIFVGSFSSANLTGYVDTPVVVPESIFTSVPSTETFTQLYNNYVSLKKGIPIAGARTVKLQVVKNYEFTDAECKNAFVAAMNAKAQQIGALTAHFSDASGLVYTDAQASANDILQILVHAAGMERIAEKWGRKAYAMTIYGSNARMENITSSVQNTTYYDDTANPILGGKTGTLTTSGQVTYNLMFCTVVNGIEIAIATIGASSEANRWQDAQKIVNYITAILNGESATLSINSSYAAACKLPANPIMYDNFPFTLLVSKSPSTLGKRPASLTKVMSLITAYDYITDENEFVTIKSSDLIGGSGANISAGDVVNIRDLVFDMLLPSSNNAATAIARYCGYKILKQQTIGNE